MRSEEEIKETIEQLHSLLQLVKMGGVPRKYQELVEDPEKQIILEAYSKWTRYWEETTPDWVTREFDKDNFSNDDLIAVMQMASLIAAKKYLEWVLGENGKEEQK